MWYCKIYSHFYKFVICLIVLTSLLLRWPANLSSLMELESADISPLSSFSLLKNLWGERKRRERRDFRNLKSELKLEQIWTIFDEKTVCNLNYAKLGCFEISIFRLFTIIVNLSHQRDTLWTVTFNLACSNCK